MQDSVKIAPSILSSDFSRLGEEISVLEKTQCDYIHIDVMDGHFVPNLTIGPSVIKSIRPYTKKTFDVHLMVNPVRDILPAFIDSGADIITIHHEITDDVFECINLIKKNKLKVGISIKPNTEPNAILKYLDLIDLVLIMTVEPGFGGQKFIIDIEVDGGINFDTAKLVIEAGANILVSGSTIFNSDDYGEAILRLKGNEKN